MAKLSRGEQFAKIIGEGYTGMLVLAFSFPSESACVACHYACMERRLDYALWDGVGSQLHIVIRPGDEAAAREIVREFGGTDRRAVL